MNKNCLHCGKKVPRCGAKLRVYTPGTNYQEWTWVANPGAGKPRVSGWMSAIDPQGMFCTMLCAARFAVAAAREGWRAQ